MKLSVVRSVALGTALSLAALSATSTFAANPMVGGAPMMESKNIIENASTAKNLTTLVAAIKAAGLVSTLEGKGPFTVFAPTNKAFEALPKGTVDSLLKPENKAKLVTILTCHVVAAKALSTDVISMVKAGGGKHVVDTVGGCKLTLAVKGSTVTVTDETGGVAKVTVADVIQSNGVVHVIDKVLMPKK